MILSEGPSTRVTTTHPESTGWELIVTRWHAPGSAGEHGTPGCALVTLDEGIRKHGAFVDPTDLIAALVAQFGIEYVRKAIG